MIELRGTNPGILNETILKILEKYWAINLPISYREFLLQYNGGEPKGNTCFLFKGDLENGSVISCFFGVTLSTMNLLNLEKDRGIHVPKRLFPIALDSFGNLICISVMNPDRGKIWFWDHEQETDPPDDSNLTLIADSFEEFLNGLYKVPLPE